MPHSAQRAAAPAEPTLAGAPRLRRLSELPGPAPWPLVGNAFQARLHRLHRDLEGWAREYGPIYKARLGNLPFVVVSDHRLITAMLRDRPEGFRRPKRLYETVVEMGIKPNVFLAEGEQWQRQRRMVMASFSPGQVRAYFPMMRNVALRLQRRWNATIVQGQDIDLQADLMRFTVDVIAGLAFGRDMNTLESGDDVIQRHLDRIFPAVHHRTNALIPYWRVVPLPKDVRLAHSVAEVHRAIAGFIAEARARLAADPQRRLSPANLLEAMLVAADEPGSGLDDDAVVGNVFIMLLAGEDTTATTLSWMIHLLWQHPNALQRACDEVRRIVAAAGGLERLEPEHLAEMAFLEGCAHEAMRLKPVGPFNVVEPVRETVVGDVVLPKGMTVIALMRPDATSDRHFPQGERFMPERWLDTDQVDKRASMPFGSGPRICPGRYLALVEIKLAMATLLAGFDVASVHTVDGRDEVRELMALTMNPVGLRMRLAARAG